MKVETKLQMPTGKAKSSEKKVQAKGRKRGKGKEAEAANQETKDLPAENGENKN
jgi:hypothetical protein